MMIFSANNVSKTYNDKTLFDDIAFGMESGERIGIIGKNGAGKSTLMKIVAGLETPDTGGVVFNNSVRFEYLDQNPVFDTYDVVLDYVMKGRSDVFDYLEKYDELCKTIETNTDPAVRNIFDTASRYLDLHDGWTLAGEATRILSTLGIEDVHKSVHELSGGLKKRVALARALISNPDLLIMDEPTNHLDADSVQWLQDRLMDCNNSLLFVTHDRYFLDAVATKIIEIDKEKIYIYTGNYERFLEQKENLVAAQDATVEHLKSKLRMELVWLARGAKARRTKAKGRISSIHELVKDTIVVKEKKIKIEVGKSFIGSRIIDAHNISKSINGKKLFDNFTYIATPGDRIGIIGPNGCGKSTLLNILAELDKSDTGTIKTGNSIRVGYYRQEADDLKENQSVISSLKEIAEYIDVGLGRDRYLTTRDLLNKFLFPPSMHNSYISTLSGGEKKRLALIRLLMGNPNVLLLDEPTNDFDLDTMYALEDYLDNFYGTLLVVSHDRAFLDRIVSKIFSFGKNGIIKEYPGNYSDYLEKIEEEKKAAQSNLEPTAEKVKRIKSPGSKKKLTYNEQREYDNIENDIAALELRIGQINEILHSSDGSNYKELELLSVELSDTEQKIGELTSRWLELSEMTE
ncbi:MAG: ABC-F family ATP-binding cassette domain-containing protein [Candidatus Kapabacteria bacterium]|nr:ABC-F family ATP-binding cassette domain-containing protein [Candidatus Kapabacteria bacterium]